MSLPQNGEIYHRGPASCFGDKAGSLGFRTSLTGRQELLLAWNSMEKKKKET